MKLSTYISIVLLNVNGINAPNKTTGNSQGKKQKANKNIFYILPTKDSLKIKRNRKIVSEGIEKKYSIQMEIKAILISENVDFKTKYKNSNRIL